MGKEVARVVVLISDGEDFGADTHEVVEALYEMGVHVYTLGVGTARGAKVPADSGGYKYDKRSGAVVISRLNSDPLREVAVQAKGRYFEIDEKKNEVPNLIESIAQIEGTLQKADTVDVGANKYAYFLLAVLFLMLLDHFTYVRVFRI